jgi:hypothetical protein
LGPSSVPLAHVVSQARSASRFSDTRVERGVVANNAFYHSLFDATAEYHRSDESPGSCAGPESGRCVRGAEHRTSSGGYCASGYRGFTRGWDSIIRASSMQASLQEEAREPECSTLLLARRSRPRPRAVCHTRLSARGTVEHPALSFVTWPASRLGDACSGSESPFSRRRRTGALRGFLLRVPPGYPSASRGLRGRRRVAEVARRLPHAWELTEVRSVGARHAAGTR